MKKNKYLKVIFYALVCALVFLYFGIVLILFFSMKKDWIKAKAENTISSYTLFINTYPNSFLYSDSKYIDAAKIKLNKLVEIKYWEKAKVVNTVNSYDLFINKYPNSVYINIAKTELKRLVEIKDWEKAKVENTFNSYDVFITKHPNSKYLDVAKIEINKLFMKIIPEKLTCELNSNLSVVIRWSSVTGAQKYMIYHSKNKNQIISKNNKPEFALDQFIISWPDEFPMYYIIIAVKGNIESKPSNYCQVDLLSSQNGTKCQICGEKALGYCHNRGIYVCSSHNTYTSKEGTNWRCP